MKGEFIHFYHTDTLRRTEGLSRIVDLFEQNFEYVSHCSSWGDYKSFLALRIHPNHALDLGGIGLYGTDIVTVPDLIPWLHPKEFHSIVKERKRFRNPIRRFHTGLSMAKRIVAISEETKCQLQILGYRCDKVIHLPISESMLQHGNKENGEKKRNGILIVGNNHPRKRFHVAVEVAYNLGESLTWIGTDLIDGVCDIYESKIRELCYKLKVPFSRLVNSTDETLINAYKTHRFLLITSPWEGYCLPIPEALYFGLPVVAGYIDGFPRDTWIEKIYKGLIPVANSVGEISELSNYDAKRKFDDLDAFLHCGDEVTFVESYRDIYEQIGAYYAVPMKSHTKERLNIGCGPYPKSGYVNVDIKEQFKPDVAHNLDSYPWPFADSSMNEVRAFHILEHLQNPFLAVNEIYRILKPGGRFILQVPHKKSPDAIRDWGHINPLWDRKKIEWLSRPTEYVEGLSFILKSYYEEHSFVRYGNITAVYLKENLHETN